MTHKSNKCSIQKQKEKSNSHKSNSHRSGQKEPSSAIKSSMLSETLSKSSPKKSILSSISHTNSTSLKNLQRNLKGRTTSTTKSSKERSSSSKSVVFRSRERIDPRNVKQNDNVPLEASAENTFEQTPTSQVSGSDSPANFDSSLVPNNIFNEDVISEFNAKVMHCLSGMYCDPEQFLEPVISATHSNYLERHVDPEKLITFMVDHMKTYYNLSDDKDPFSGLRQQMDDVLWDSLAFIIPMLCQQLVRVVQEEPMIVTDIESDVLIFGDIHGNFNDIYYIYENIISNSKYANSRFIFLGDYVDRGPKPVEVCSFLFALKLSNPKRFFLLRGNHEVLKINRKYGFMHMCDHLFHDTYVIRPTALSELIYMSFNRAFCFLPAAAVIKGTSAGKRIFCCHGGIPSYYKGGSHKGKKRGEEMSTGWTIANLNASLSKPASLAPSKHGTPAERAFNEILWNDPLPSKFRKKSRYKKHKYYVNRKRGGHCSFFSESGLRAFLDANNLSMVIRGHQYRHTMKKGYQYDFNGALLTVFSSSNYCGTEKNTTGYVHVKGHDCQVHADTLRRAKDAEKYRGFNILKIVVDKKTKAVTHVAF